MIDDDCLTHRWDQQFGKVFDPLPYHPTPMNEPAYIPNPEWLRADFDIVWPDFSMICIGPPPAYLIDHTGQLEFPFILDIIDLDEQ